MPAAQSVANATHRLDDRGRAARACDLAPKGLDVGIDGAIAECESRAPNEIDDARAREDVTRLAEKQRQQIELDARELEFLSTPTCAPRGLRDAQDGFTALCTRRAPEHGLDSGNDLAWRERFDDVVVSAHFERANSIGFCIATGEHDDGRPVSDAGRDLGNEIEATAIGQHQVQEQEIRGRLEFGPRLLERASLTGQKLCFPEGIGNRFGDGRLILDHEDRTLGHG